MQECMFVDSGFIIIEEFTSIESEDWNFHISLLHSDLITRMAAYSPVRLQFISR